MLKTRDIGTIAVVAVGALAGSAIAEDITVTSYFPSPRGAFEQVIATGECLLGTNAGAAGGAVQVGTTTAAVAATPKFHVVNGAFGVGIGGTRGTPAPAIDFYRAAGAAVDASLTATAADTLQVSGADFVVSRIGGVANTGHIRIGGSFFCQQAVDVSENMAIAASQLALAGPGHVMTVDPGKDESMVLASRAYDPSVVGVISAQPGLLLGAEREGMSLALSGRVPTKVTAENGPIRRGDLLVTSSKPGFAMRGDPEKIQSGMVIGKALGELPEGEGEIVVLVNLQ